MNAAIAHYVINSDPMKLEKIKQLIITFSGALGQRR